jgi:putative flippase GtrA
VPWTDALRGRQAQLRELLRFGSVGLASSAVYFALLWLVTRLTSWPAGISGTIAYALSIVVNYVLQKSFTFKSDRRHQQAGPRYLLIHLGGMLLNGGFLWLGVDLAGWSYIPVQLAAMVVVTIWSYLGQRFWAFQPQQG